MSRLPAVSNPGSFEFPMNQIIKQFMEDFNESEELTFPEPSENFEAFSNFSIVSKEYKNDFDIDDVSMGETQGIDGLAIIANGNLVTSTEEVDDLVEKNNYLEASFVFIQAKTRRSFEGADISNFFASINDFLSDSPQFTQTAEIQRAIQFKDKIWEHVSKMKKGNPICRIYYVTTGQWQEDKSLKVRVENHVSDLRKMSLFEGIEFIPCGASEIQDLYLQTKRGTECEFIFEKHVVLPAVKSVQEAYSGVVKFDEFLKIITDDGGLKDVFYENVRDFLGESNSVNEEIEATLKGADLELFSLLNNGITMVANTKTNKGNVFYIENYQIVNGCQTSHVLFNNKDREGMNNIYVPLKLIITDDDNIQNKVIVATNNQTSIPKEQLEAFSKFQKELELFYDSETSVPAKLFYERRQRQYRDKKVSRPRIVTIREQIKVFAAMFLDQPHTASGYFSKVYTSNKEKMFIEGDKYDPYYISAFGMYKLLSLISIGAIDKKYRMARYHILMIFRMQFEKNIPKANSRAMEKYCARIKEVLLRDDETDRRFKDAIAVLESVKSINLEEPETLYTGENTELLKEVLS